MVLTPLLGPPSLAFPPLCLSWEDQNGQPLPGLLVSACLSSSAEKMSLCTLDHGLHIPEDQWAPIPRAQLSVKMGFLTNHAFLR